MNVTKNGEVIVDIRVSINGVQGQELLTYGYVQLVPDFGPGNPRPANFAELGTFGKGQSMWIWKRKQGKHNLYSADLFYILINYLINRHLLWSHETNY